MPKLKTKSGATKRFRKTATGKIKRKKAFASHLMTKKGKKRKRNLKKSTFVHSSESKTIKRMI